MSDRPDNEASDDTRALELEARPAGYAGQALHDACVTSIRCLSDGSLLTTGWDGHARVWDRETGTLLRAFDLGFQRVDLLALDVASDLAVFGIRRELAVVDLDTGEPIADFAPRQLDSLIHSAAFHPDGDLLITGSMGKTIEVWDLNSGTRIDAMRGHRHAVSIVDLNREGTVVVSACTGGEVLTWELASGTLRSRTWLSQTPLTVACSLDDERFAFGDAAGGITVWNAKSDKVTARFEAHAGALRDIARLDERRIATVSTDGEARVWRLSDAELLAWYDAQIELHACIFDGNDILITTDDGRLISLYWPDRAP